MPAKSTSSGDAAAAPPPTAILVVDDDESFRAMLVRTLSHHGYAVTSAENGRQAKQVLRTLSFALVITDIIMPEADGLELLMHIAGLKPRPAVITMSGGGSYLSATQILTMSAKLGAREPLRKPFTQDELIRAVRAVLG